MPQSTGSVNHLQGAGGLPLQVRVCGVHPQVAGVRPPGGEAAPVQEEAHAGAHDGGELILRDLQAVQERLKWLILAGCSTGCLLPGGDGATGPARHPESFAHPRPVPHCHVRPHCPP